MNVYETDRDCIARVWGRLESRLDAYPGELRELAVKFRWSIRADERMYFSSADAAPLLYLPIWLGRAGAGALDDILEATALLYWFVRIQDNVLDEPDHRGHPPLLLVGNLLLWDALELYRGVTSDARFWAHARGAWQTFCEETEQERQWMEARARYPADAFARHARKVAVAEIPVYAAMAASGDWAGVECVAPLVQDLGIAYGLLNDVAGHERDLAAGAHTHLIATAGVGAGSDDPEAIRHVLRTSDLLESFLDRAAQAHVAALAPAGALGMATFPAFTTERLARLALLRDRLSLRRLSAAT